MSNSNPGAAEFWRGYRNAKVFAYIGLLERESLLDDALDTDGYSEQFKSGFHAGLEAMKIELESLLEKE